MVTAKQIAELAATYIERGFVKGEWSVDASGRYVESFSSEAVAWCVDGAVECALHNLGYNTSSSDPSCRALFNQVESKLASAMKAKVGNPDNMDEVTLIFSVNDHPNTTKEDILYYLSQVS